MKRPAALLLVCCSISFASFADDGIDRRKAISPRFATAEAKYKEALGRAQDEMLASLESEREIATREGKLELALLIRDRMVAIRDEAALEVLALEGALLPAGKVRLEFDNKARRQYDFSEPGIVSLLGDSPSGGQFKAFPKPHRVRVAWQREDEVMRSYAYWEAAGAAQVERFTVEKDGHIRAELFSDQARVVAEGKLPRK